MNSQLLKFNSENGKENHNHEDNQDCDIIGTCLSRVTITGNQKEQLPEADFNKNNMLTSPGFHHRLSEEIKQITKEQIKYAKMGIGKDGWQLFAEEGEMKMYRRAQEVNGIVIDPLKACHYVEGVTAHEICKYFFKPEFRYEWETTLETNGMTILEKLSEDTLVFHQIHKRVWPAAQRDAVFWSHIRELPKNDEDDDAVFNSYVVVNHSTKFDTHSATNAQYVRMNMTVTMLCQTIILNQSKSQSELTREEVACKIMYCAVINPGGWVPASGLRMVYKREYPRFLRKFTAYVKQKTQNKPILF